VLLSCSSSSLSFPVPSSPSLLLLFLFILLFSLPFFLSSTPSLQSHNPTILFTLQSHSTSSVLTTRSCRRFLLLSVSSPTLFLFSLYLPPPSVFSFSSSLSFSPHWLIFFSFLSLFFFSFVWVLIVLVSPIGWPLAKVLDCVLGHQEANLYRREELKEFLALHAKEEGKGISKGEFQIMQGAIDMQGKKAGDYMTPLNMVHLLNADDKLDRLVGRRKRRGRSEAHILSLPICIYISSLSSLPPSISSFLFSLSPSPLPSPLSVISHSLSFS
jgi:CBS domain containing-hemolysin-like protein